MGWSKSAQALLLASLLGPLAVTPALAAQLCPVRADHPLRFVNVFDGPAEELAFLIPEETGEKSGFWTLGYIYDAGRFVTLQCKYADGTKIEKKMTDKLSRCDYRVEAKTTLRLNCR